MNALHANLQKSDNHKQTYVSSKPQHFAGLTFSFSQAVRNASGLGL